MDDIYSNNYKKFLILPILVLIPVIFLILISPGLSLGIELTGGNALIIYSDKELSPAQIEGILASDFNLGEVSVSTISSPVGHGAYIEYSKNESILDAEALIEQAQLSIEAEKDEEAVSFSNEAIKVLGFPLEEYDNPKAALMAAQDALAKRNSEFSSALEKALSEKLGLGESAEFQQREVSPTLGKASLNSGIFLISVSAIILIIIIFIFFRQLIPVFGIIQAMVFDVLAALAGMAFLGIPISLLTISTLLMVVAYSVDTNIMLTSRMLKDRDGTPGKRATSSVKTGITMSATSLAALIAMLFISGFYHIDLVYQIAAIMTFGLFGDIVATWTTNVSILMWHTERVRK
jgi:preprotein translocase subunit SecF